ncbi:MULTISPECIES: threonine/serine ThrE exporter family protein [Aerococcus]|uniref:threonine/serine ThrE exporter family protein n=1 Tax=Aerococcus TaxID=1375 RepID=UPI000DCE3BA3|nr:MULTISPECIES: threonine/serine exporter family protein [Aerococcus]KAA9298013.1 threonine/serine exporter family protein [Aerococcus tenax]MDK6689629.1 threonine/serine exporter family protein [Aerococcus urinae]MDK8133353.1 threonine/serine exporter family protein [Aerococcus urinae]MDK8484868.1 threonine/serine exporter family protein [Aerococcus urinae]MDL5177723.1 threonine/serine exporter family protein [Aerococcus tenax]
MQERTTKQTPTMQKKILETALLAGQIMCESNAESYRVEDTMNRILTYSKASYAVAVSFSTSIYAILDDPNYASGGFAGIKRITSRSNNLNKISKVNTVSRALLGGKISMDEAYQELTIIRQASNQYSTWVSSLGIIGLALSFSVLFEGGLVEFIASGINGVILSLMTILTDKYYINHALSNVIQSLVVTLAAYLMLFHLFPEMNVATVIVATLMPMVPGTAITNSLRDIFREDYIAGSARAMEAFFEALMIAIGSVVGLAILGGLSHV